MNCLTRLKERLLDITARKPSGWLGRLIYGRFSGGEQIDRLVLERLSLQRDDIYLELGQGGGILLDWVLEIASEAAAIDHSFDMVRLSRQRNRVAVEQGRLQLVHGDAASLPWRDGAFTCCACLRTFLFFSKPIQVLEEVSRVLKPGGRFVILTPANRNIEGETRRSSSSQDLLHRYTETELSSMLTRVGFVSVAIETVSSRLLCRAQTPS